MIRDVGDRPTVVHIIFRFDYGGLENGVVNILRGLVDDDVQHIVVALTEATAFADRLPEGIALHSIGKRPGKDPAAYFRLFRLLRRLKPSVVHTRNMGTIDCALIAFLARVPVRIHGEHGWDIFDPDGTNPKYRRVRRVLAPLIHKFVTVSDDLGDWLIDTVGIRSSKVQRLRNGVDVRRFHPVSEDRCDRLPAAIGKPGNVVVGSVTRFSAIKDPLNLVRAFSRLATAQAAPGGSAVLVMIGAGELHADAVAAVEATGVAELSWLPGARDDVPELMRAMDVFVLGSLKEGISNTILEAMASGLPVVACETGGNHELVADGVNGCLVPPGDSEALASAIGRYVDDASLRREHGNASRDRAENEFSIDAMIERYRNLYNWAIARALK
ncbi:MAG: TIGR03088 family PEP-CTERM/XrtA system glycosyltransferase [Pseudomonadota bacterium]